MSKLAEKKPLVSLGKPKANVATLAAQNDGGKAPKQDQKRLNVNIDSPLHNRFKIAVVSQGKDMSKVVTELLEQWLKDNE
ncbi:MAG: ParG [Pseudomonadales bacterium 32-61-5]|nr:MAG: ParG [Pseudomonadales bacterium 32-61-5]